jgi:HK97 family phage prohead protease
MPRQMKDFTFKVKAVDDSGTFTGFASTYGGPPDLQNDIVAPGAFKQAINMQPSNGYPLLWAHDQAEPIGLAKISDSALGLMTNGSLNLDTDEGQKAYSNLKFGSVRGMSIGYDCLDGQYTYDQDGVRTLNLIRLHEISLVSVPANPNALITGVKSLDEARRMLRDAAVNPDAITLAQLRSISNELVSILDPEDLEDEDPDDEEDLADQKQATLILKNLARELKGIRL